MTSQALRRSRGWQKNVWVQVLAILIGYGSTYVPTILSHLGREQPLSARDILFYTTVVGSVGIILMLLLLRYLCGERVRDLSPQPGTWWKDILFGIGLVVVTLGTHTLLRGPLMRLFPPAPDSGLGDRFFNELAGDPVLFGLMMGPRLVIGAGIFEELSRVFLLTRLWNISPSKTGRWFGIMLSAALFGLAHLYQGPGGMIGTGLFGLILGIYYHVFGRVVPMMLSHYLHDAIQFAVVYLMANAP